MMEGRFVELSPMLYQEYRQALGYSVAPLQDHGSHVDATGRHIIRYMAHPTNAEPTKTT